MYHAGPALRGKRRKKKTKVASSDTTEVLTVPHAHPAQDNCIPSSGALSEGLGEKGGAVIWPEFSGKRSLFISSDVDSMCS